MLRQGLTLSRRPWPCHLSQFQQQHPAVLGSLININLSSLLCGFVFPSSLFTPPLIWTLVPALWTHPDLPARNRNFGLLPCEVMDLGTAAVRVSPLGSRALFALYSDTPTTLFSLNTAGQFSSFTERVKAARVLSCLSSFNRCSSEFSMPHACQQSEPVAP